MNRRWLLVVLAGCAEAAAPPPSTMLVADRAGNRIVAFDGRSGEWRYDAATIDRPSSMRVGPDGTTYVATFGDSAIVRVDGTVFYKDTEILEEPVELVFDGAQLLVLGHDTHNAIVIDPTGAMVHDVGYPDMRGAHDLALGDAGLIYVATEHDVTLGTAIQVWDLAQGTMIDRMGTLDQIANATGIVAADNALYVTDYERGQLVRFDPATHEMHVLSSELVHPISLELGPDDRFYVSDERGIHRLDKDGEYVSLFVAVGEHLTQPRSVTFVLDNARR